MPDCAYPPLAFCPPLRFENDAVKWQAVSDSRASFRLDHNNYDIRKEGSATTIRGGFGDGEHFELSSSGDPHVLLRITHRDGSTSEQKFDYHANALFVLPNGDKVALQTSPFGADGNVTEQRKMAILSRDGSVAVALDHVGSDGQPLQVRQDHLGPFEAWDYLNRTMPGPDGVFMGQVFQVDPRGVTLLNGERATTDNVAAQERLNASYPDMAECDMAFQLVDGGLRCAGDGGEGQSLRDLTERLRPLLEHGGYLRLRDRDGQTLMGHVPGRHERDGQDEQGWQSWGEPPCLPYLPRSSQLQARDAADYLSMWLENQGRDELSFPALHALAGGGSSREQRAASVLLAQGPERLDALDASDGFNDGSVSTAQLQAWGSGDWSPRAGHPHHAHWVYA
jgi:hypothetical protein